MSLFGLKSFNFPVKIYHTSKFYSATHFVHILNLLTTFDQTTSKSYEYIFLSTQFTKLLKFPLALHNLKMRLHTLLLPPPPAPPKLPKLKCTTTQLQPKQETLAFHLFKTPTLSVYGIFLPNIKEATTLFFLVLRRYKTEFSLH